MAGGRAGLRGRAGRLVDDWQWEPGLFEGDENVFKLVYGVITQPCRYTKNH